jgi:hypothetical protein
MTQPHLRAQLQDMGRRDPRLRHLPNQQQLAKMTRIRTIGLRTLLPTEPLARLGRLSQAHLRTRRLELLDEKTPTSRRLVAA